MLLLMLVPLLILVLLVLVTRPALSASCFGISPSTRTTLRELSHQFLIAGSAPSSPVLITVRLLQGKGDNLPQESTMAVEQQNKEVNKGNEGGDDEDKDAAATGDNGLILPIHCLCSVYPLSIHCISTV
jgi:hypothetical protein